MTNISVFLITRWVFLPKFFLVLVNCLATETCVWMNTILVMCFINITVSYNFNTVKQHEIFRVVSLPSQNYVTTQRQLSWSHVMMAWEVPTCHRKVIVAGDEWVLSRNSSSQEIRKEGFWVVLRTFELALKLGIRAFALVNGQRFNLRLKKRRENVSSLSDSSSDTCLYFV